MDFSEDPEAEEFVMEWNQEVLKKGKSKKESFTLYPRYQESSMEPEISDFTGCKIAYF